MGCWYFLRYTFSSFILYMIFASNCMQTFLHVLSVKASTNTKFKRTTKKKHIMIGKLLINLSCFPEVSLRFFNIFNEIPDFILKFHKKKESLQKWKVIRKNFSNRSLYSKSILHFNFYQFRISILWQ